MVTHVRTFGLSGITGFSVDAEINIAKGLPDFDIIGMGNMAVREAAGRIRAALENSGYPFPLGRVTVNLAPAGIRKEGACYDLAIAVGILLCGSCAGVRTGRLCVCRRTFPGRISAAGARCFTHDAGSRAARHCKLHCASGKCG